MGKGPKQVAAKAAARVNAAVRNHEQPPTADDVSSAETAIASAAPVAADARGESPRDQDHGVVPQEELIYSGESDGGSDSTRSPRSPESRGATEYEPTNRTQAGSQAYGHY